MRVEGCGFEEGFGEKKGDQPAELFPSQHSPLPEPTRPPASGLGVRGLGLGVCGLGYGVWGLGLRFGVWGLGFGVWGLGFGFWVLSFGV